MKYETKCSGFNCGWYDGTECSNYCYCEGQEEPINNNNSFLLFIEDEKTIEIN